MRNEPGWSGRRRARRRERAGRKVCVEEPGRGVGAEGKEGAGRAGGRAPAGRGGAARGRPQSALGLPTPRLRDPRLLPAFPRLGAPLLACLCHAPNRSLHAGPYSTSPGPHRNLGLRPGRARGRGSRLAGWTPVEVPRHEEPRGAGPHGPWGSLPTPPRPYPSPEPPRRSALSRPRARPQLPGPQTPPRPGDCARPARTRFVWFSPRGLFLEFLPFPSSRTSGPSLATRGPRGGRLDTTSPPSFGRTGAGRGGGDAGAPRAWAGAGLGGGEAGLRPALRTSPALRTPPAASFSARAEEPLLAGSGTRLYWGCVYPVFRPHHLPPLPSPPHSSIPEGVKTTLTTAPGQEVTGARGGEGGRLVKRLRLAPRPDVRLPTPDVLHLCRTAV